MKLSGISVLLDIAMIFIADTEFSVIHAGFRHTEHSCRFHSAPTAHIVFEYFLCPSDAGHPSTHPLDCNRSLLFRNSLRDHRQCFVVCKIYVFYISLFPAMFVKISVRFSVAGKLYGDLNSLPVFAVDIIDIPVEELK